MRALVIDDSPTMRSMIKSHLTRLGWTIAGEGENGVEALELARTLKPDLMTLDIIMPEMDGIECYRHLRQIENPPRVLIISVLAAEARIIQAYEAEIYSAHFLKKPFSDKELKEKLDLVMATGALPYPVVKEIGGAAQQAEPAPAAAASTPPGPQSPPIPLN